MNKSSYTEVRLKTIDEYLRTSTFYTVEDLKLKVERRFEDFSSKESKSISVRQIQKDLNFLLQESGQSKDEFFDIQHGGYNNLVPAYRYSDRGYRRGSHLLEPEDLDHLEIILDQLQQFEGRPHLEWISAFRMRIDNQIEKEKNKKADRVIVSYHENDYLKGIEYFMPLYENIRNKETLNITYKPFQKDSRNFNFSPYYLKQFNGRWFVFGLDHSNPSYPSNLALDRITRLNASGEPYDKSQDQNWDKYFKFTYGVTKDNKEPEEISLKFKGLSWEYYISKPLHIEKKPISKTRVYSEDRDYMIITFVVIPNYEFKSWVRSFGKQVEIVDGELNLDD